MNAETLAQACASDHRHRRLDVASRRQLRQASDLSNRVLKTLSDTFDLATEEQSPEIFLLDDSSLLGVYCRGAIGLSRSVLDGSAPTCNLTLAHEVAHHCWRHVEIDNPLYREGLAEFSAILALMRLGLGRSARLGLHFCKARMMRAAIAGESYRQDARLYGIAPLSLFAHFAWRPAETLAAIRRCLDSRCLAPLTGMPAIGLWMEADPFSIASMVSRDEGRFTWLSAELPGYCLTRSDAGIAMQVLPPKASVNESALCAGFQPCPTLFGFTTPDLFLLQRSLDAR